MRDRLPGCAALAAVAALIGVSLLAGGCGHPSSAMAPVADKSPATVDTAPAKSPTPEPPQEGVAPAAPAAAQAPAAAPPVKSRPPAADRGPSRPGEAEKITFDDLNIGMQADMVYRPILFEGHRVKELDGKRVSIRGYIHPGATGRGIKEFVLLRNLQCKFGAGGQADHLAQVFMQKGSTVDYRLEDVKIEGTLKIQPFEGPDGNTWSIYRLEEAVAR
jgi:hypothetical protein